MLNNIVVNIFFNFHGKVIQVLGQSSVPHTIMSNGNTK